MILYKPNCAANFSVYYEPILLTYENVKISFSGKCGCWPPATSPGGKDFRLHCQEAAVLVTEVAVAGMTIIFK